VYVAPVLSELTVSFCDFLVIQRHVRLSSGVHPTSVEVVLFRADPDVLCAPSATMAGPYVTGGALPSRPHCPAMGVINELQMREGRWVNFFVLNGIQIVRFVVVHSVEPACGMAEAMYGETQGAHDNSDDFVERVSTSRVLEPMGYIVSDIDMAEA